MVTWHYYRDGKFTVSGSGRPSAEVERVLKDIESIGATQLDLMLKAREGDSGMVILEPGNERQRLAARRLVERGLLRRAVQRPKFNTRLAPPHPQRLRTYFLTQRGKSCWLRVAR